MTPAKNPRIDPAPPAELRKLDQAIDRRAARDLATRQPSKKELEASLEAYFNRTVRLRLGGRTLKVMPTEKGAPDRMVLLPGGRIYLVELKTDTGKASAAQDLWHERAADLGTRVWVLHGRAEIDAWINARAAALDATTRR